MENKTNNSPKTGLLKLGYVTNLKTCKTELNEMLADEQQVSTTELNTIVDGARIVYLNKYGYAQKRTGEEQSLRMMQPTCTSKPVSKGSLVILSSDGLNVRVRTLCSEVSTGGRRSLLKPKSAQTRCFIGGISTSTAKKKASHSLKTSLSAQSLRPGRSRTNLQW